ncbi:MAG: quercetin dioxygenase-like cupin family protein [Gammaproteobacteria bacterium]|jgi:quercetin dioxygenase-like cupin family protein
MKDKLVSVFIALLLSVSSSANAKDGVRKLFNLNTVNDELNPIIAGQLSFKFWHGEEISVGVFRMVRNEQGHFPGKINRHGEEVALLTEGRIEMSIEGKTYTFGENEILIIPPFMPHTGVCLTDVCTLLSWFTPNRESEWGAENNDKPELSFIKQDTAP